MARKIKKEAFVLMVKNYLHGDIQTSYIGQYSSFYTDGRPQDKGVTNYLYIADNLEGIICFSKEQMEFLKMEFESTDQKYRYLYPDNCDNDEMLFFFIIEGLATIIENKKGDKIINFEPILEYQIL